MCDTRDRNNCCHCAISRAINEFSDAHSPLNVDQIIDDLSACICELIASYGDAGQRWHVAQRTAEMIPERVRHFRAIGRYPGGSNSALPQILQ
ncbi:MAG: hypothetical protein WBP94_02825 [Rhodomicrobiaceae bacterium]